MRTRAIAMALWLLGSLGALSALALSQEQRGRPEPHLRQQVSEKITVRDATAPPSDDAECDWHWKPLNQIKCYRYQHCTEKKVGGGGVMTDKCEWARVDLREAIPEIELFIARINELIEKARAGSPPSKLELESVRKTGDAIRFRAALPSDPYYAVNFGFRDLGRQALTHLEAEAIRKQNAAEEKELTETKTAPGLDPAAGKWVRIGDLVYGPVSSPVEIQRPFWVDGARVFLWARSMPRGAPTESRAWLTVLLLIDCENLLNSVMTSLELGHNELPPPGSTAFTLAKKLSREIAHKNPEALLAIERNLQVMGLLKPIERGTVQELAARTTCPALAR